MNYTKIKKSLLWSFLGFLGLTAIIGIFSLIFGAWGKIQFKILSTCLTISMSSIAALSCAAAVEKKRQIYLAFPGIILSLLTALLLIFGVWAGIREGEFWQAVATGIVLSIGLSHACLLGFAKLPAHFSWVLPATSASILLLTAQISAAIIFGIDEEAYYILLGVVAIIVGLETVAVPILAVLGRQSKGATTEVYEPNSSKSSKTMKENPINKTTANSKGEGLLLQCIEGGIWSDSDGRLYRVEPLEPEAGEVFGEV
jgi:hypothetical protein